MENIKLSVRELVEFVYKSGDLKVGLMNADRAMEGIKAHKLLQSQMGNNYEKEYYLKHEFEFKNIKFYIEGRADGILVGENGVIIDEIKSTYIDLDLLKDNHNLAHIGQAKCYAYIYSLQNEIQEIYIQLRYYNLESKKTKVFTTKYTFIELENFFYELINCYIDWAETIINLHQIRKETINDLKFPFDNYRKGQRDFSVAVYQTIMSRKKLFAQAPTGVGKTISVLFPAIKAMNTVQKSKIFYLTAKSTTKNIAFDTVKLMTEKGLKLRTTVITAKEKICFQEKLDCDPEICPYARSYYDKLNNILLNIIKNECLFDRDYIETICKENELCPFEFSLDLSYISDLVICDYNYYFDPRVALQRNDSLKNSKDILLIDEAHNLEDRARNMFSPEIIKEEYFNLHKTMKNINIKIYKELKFINKAFLIIKKELEETKSIMEGLPPDLISSLRRFIVECEIYINDINQKNIPEELLDLYFKSIFFIKIYDIINDNFCIYAEFIGGKTKVKIFLVDPSSILKEIEKNAYSCIFFSATLTPLKYFRYMLGGEEDDYILKLNSPFEYNNLNIMITADISMKYAVRDLNINRACDYINTATSSRMGNYIVFFPSYNYMNKVYNIYKDLYHTENIIVQNQNISESEQEEILEYFNKKRDLILFTVVGGIFSEGVDLPLEKLIGAVIIGTGIPQISFERDIIKNFFQRKFKMGYDFAYRYPGFNKILQSAGRVIRTEKDKGILLLIDSRFCEYSYTKLFPEHWKNYKKVYSTKKVQDSNKIFWKGRDIANDKYSI